jgi:hypothetical protein
MARTLRCPCDVRPRRSRSVLTIATTTSLMLALAACGAADPARTHGVSAVQFQDVVVPAGLRIVEDGHRSYSREESHWRLGHFEYVGQVDLALAANYVRERMPQHGWSKVRDEAGETSTRLGFERGKYLANYTLTRSEGATIMVVDYTTDFSRR